MNFINKQRVRMLFASLILAGGFPLLAIASSNISVGVEPFSPIPSSPSAPKIYITNSGSNNVSVIDTSDNTVIATIPVGANPTRAIASTANKYYVLNSGSNTVSVIDTTTDTVTTTISVGNNPTFVGATPKKLYVLNSGSNDVSVITIATDTVTATIPVGTNPVSAAPAPGQIFVINQGSNNVTMIDTATDTVTDTISVGTSPVFGVAALGKMYIANSGSNDVSVINITSHAVTATIPVGTNPARETFNPVGLTIYVVNQGSNNVSVIDPNTDTVTATISVGDGPLFSALVTTIGFPPKIYVINSISGDVSVVGTSGNTVDTTISVGDSPNTMLFNSTLAKVYVVNRGSDDVSVIDTGTDELIDVGQPVLLTTDVVDTTITLTYDESLDEGSVPIPGDFDVLVNGSPATINLVDVVGATVVLVLDTPVVYGDNVETSYTADINPLLDLNGNFAPEFLGQLVTNNTAIVPRVQRHSSVVGGIHYGCKDPNANNYEQFAASKPELCKYPEKQITPTMIPSRTLKIGMTGEDVKTLQTFLNVYISPKNSLKPDGKFGPKTKSFVIQFQKAKALYPDGVVGPRTWAIINGIR